MDVMKEKTIAGREGRQGKIWKIRFHKNYTERRECIIKKLLNAPKNEKTTKLFIKVYKAPFCLVNPSGQGRSVK